MSTNGVNMEDADMAECDGDKVVTMMDVLQEQQEFEDDANAVLGASDDKNCTYSKGYIKRQALYACLTCCSDAKEDPAKRAGVCLACSLACHENHDLVELYTKRNFRCDCGNPKFNNPCTYTQNKTQLNDDNIYNQNFSGLYCTCHRPYPDPEGIEEEMIQCIICEDWLHASHLDATIPSSEIYAEMICKACMEKNDFLHDYSEYAVNGDIDVVSSDENDRSVVGNGDSKIEEENKVDVEEVDKDIKDAEVNCEAKDDEISKETLNNTELTKVTNASLTNNDDTTEDQTDPKKSTENSDGDKSVEIDEKPNTESVTENATSDELTLNKAVSDEHNSINNTNMEIVKAGVDVLSETKDDTVPDDNMIAPNVDVVNVTDVTSKDDKFENDTDDKLDESSSGVLLQTICENDNNAADNIESLSKSEEVGEDQKPKNETETKTNKPETKTNEFEKRISDIDTNTNELEKDMNNEHSDKIPQEQQVAHSENLEDSIELNDNSSTAKREKEMDESSNVANDETTDNSAAAKQDIKMDESSNVANNETTDNSSAAKQDIEMDKSSNVANNETPDNSSAAKQDIKMDESSNVANSETIDQSKEHKRKLSTEETDDISVKKPKLDKTECIRPKSGKWFKGATFWPSHFRQKLCTCNECITMYKDLSVLFLIDPEDTVTAYETLGKERTNGTSSTSSYEKGLEALSSLDRIQQINALTEYNRMRDKLLDFLKSFKDRREVVKEEDIKAFFAGMKPKREPDGVYFCR